MVIVAGRYEATLDALAAYFYVREDLKTPISFVEAKKLSFLFAGDSKGKWYPLEEVAKMPNEQRKPYLFRFADRVARGELPKG
jgi:hypothetical protein